MSRGSDQLTGCRWGVEAMILYEGVCWIECMKLFMILMDLALVRKSGEYLLFGQMLADNFMPKIWLWKRNGGEGAARVTYRKYIQKANAGEEVSHLFI